MLLITYIVGNAERLQNGQRQPEVVRAATQKLFLKKEREHGTSQIT